MWILSPQPEGVKYYLLPGKKYVVGRKNCDVLLSNDQSISRAHAHLTTTDQTLTLTDTSKYGTFVNGERLLENQSQVLKPGDAVTFGVFHSKFSVAGQSIVVCSSCVDVGSKTSLSQALLPLGGKLVSSWSQDCTHLVMPAVKVTIKTICALLCCRPIVKPEFFTELSNALQQKIPPPAAESFFPEFDEPTLDKDEVDLRERPERKHLFSGKTFLFLSAKQMKRLGSAVGFGGGTSQLLEEGALPRPLLESPQTCVVDMASGNSQAPLPLTTRHWTQQVKKILVENGLRFITESEIGLAAIYSSCSKHCNPSNHLTDSECMKSVRATLPNATLSQNAAVDETVLPGPFLNITAYAANTELSERADQNETTSVTAVGETQERSQNRTAANPSPSRPTARGDTDTGTDTGMCSVPETLRSSINTTAHSAGSQGRTPAAKPGGGGGSASLLPPPPKSGGSVKAWPQKQSPQKQRLSAQGSPQSSPQKQATLTTFFQPVTKKRPRDEESCSGQSEPKKKSASNAAGTQSQQRGSEDMFQAEARAAGVSHPVQQGAAGVSHPVPQGPQGTKRKEMEELDELESIMSQAMDDSDEHTHSGQGQEAPSVTRGSTNGKQPSDAVEPSSGSKRQRVNPEESGRANQRPGLDLEEPSAANGNQREKHTSSAKRQSSLPPAEHRTANQRPSTGPNEGSAANQRPSTGPNEGSSANQRPSTGPNEGSLANRHSQAVKDEEVSFVVPSGPPSGDVETPLKPAAVKRETAVSETREELPKRLVLVEFKSLTVSTPGQDKPRQPANGHVKNYKRFRKMLVPGAEGLPNIIGGSDLLAHNRGKNSELDEWLRDVTEEDRQHKRDETLGDDLFRYNPTKLTKRR